MTRTSIRAALVAAVLGALAPAATAGAATGTAAIQKVDGAHLEFTLPDGYMQLAGAMRGTPVIGGFRRWVATGCDLRWQVSGRLVAKAPARQGAARLRGGGVDLRVRRGDGGGVVRRYLGTLWKPAPGDYGEAHTVLAGVAILPPPAGTAAKRQARLVVELSALTFGCDRAESAAAERGLATALWKATRTVKVVDGPPAPAPGVPVDPA